GGGTFGPPEVLTTAFNQGMVIRDLNGDGLPDLAGSNLPGNVCAALGIGNGLFASSRCFSSAYPGKVAAGDFNGDGLEDLVTVSRPVSVSGASYVSLHPGDGLGVFPFASRYLAGQMSTSIAAADFDEDGRADLAVTSGTNNEVWILRSTTCAGPDSDDDGVPDACDNCPTIPNADQNPAACDQRVVSIAITSSSSLGRGSGTVSW